LAAGHCITKIEKRHGLDTMEVAGLVAKIIREEKPVKANIESAVSASEFTIGWLSRSMAISSTPSILAESQYYHRH
jgi:hypothetical protein